MGESFAFEGLERLFHEKARLSIVTCLAMHKEGLPFPELRTLCELTDGNLNRHLNLLAESQIVAMEKRFVGNRPQTLCSLTELGSRRFAQYLDELEAALQNARAAQARLKSSRKTNPSIKLRPT
jgi:hypothetical protein